MGYCAKLVLMKVKFMTQISDLPYIHYLAKGRWGNSDQDTLVRALEETKVCSGGFFIPIQNDGKLFPYYRFDFTTYKQGDLKSHRKIFNSGIAITHGSKLTVLFPSFREIENDEFIVPQFKKRNNKSMKYTGKSKHPDFAFNFVELSEINIADFDIALLKFHVSIIGCFNYDNS